MCHRIITISREFGSGGRTIGKKVAQALGIPCYDSELILKIANESGFHSDYIKNETEYSSDGLLAPIFSNRSLGLTNQNQIWQVQSNIIKDLANKESCVIVGRCADYILKDHPNCLNVFIHADLKHRSERIIQEYGERNISIEQRIKDKDKKRAAYHRFYTDMKWGHSQNYDICLDSGKLGIDKCVSILVDLF